MKKAFTLAEVLITLGIIGVVMAMTLPSLIGKWQKTVTVNRLKNTYSLLANALLAAQAEYSESIDDIDTNLSEKEFGEKYLRPFLSTIKVCTNMYQGCWKSGDFVGYYDLKGSKITESVRYSLVLKNGTVIGVNKIADQHNIVSFIVNLDGNKGKNTMGYDIFSFYLFNKEKLLNRNPEFAVRLKDVKLKNGLYPGGYDDGGPPHMIYDRGILLSTSGYRSCNKNGKDTGGGRPGVGAACAALIAKDGWKIKEDYPW